MRVEVPGGDTIELGTVEATPTIGIIDFSRRETDDFGVTTVVPRGFARRLSVRLAVPTDDVDELQRRLADLRATSALWVADEDSDWLTVEGFYKEFTLDLPVGAISYCTLTIESLAAPEPPADAGGDPAPAGQSSTFRLLQPATVNSAALVASNVVEADYPEWSAVASYAIGARVIKAATHRIYESAAAANVGHDPAALTGDWIEVGPTNRWAMFDQALGTASTRAASIAVTLSAGSIDAVALLDVIATSVRVQSAGYDQTKAAGEGAVTFLDIPLTAGNVTVTITGAEVSVGTLLIGRLRSLGITEASPTAGITDFSRKEVDDFGDATIVERAWAKRMSAAALIRTDAIDLVANRIAAVRAVPSLWIGDDGIDSLTVYGFFKDFSIEVGENVSKLGLSIEGLSKAAPLVAPVVPEDGLSGYLTNEAHTAPADAAGVILSYAGASGSFRVMSGADDVTAAFTFDIPAGGNAQGLTGPYGGSPVNAATGDYSATGGFDAGEDIAALTIRATGSGDFAGAGLTKVFSLAKSKTGTTGAAGAAGAAGADAKLIYVSSTHQTFNFTAAGAVLAQTTTFTAKRQNTAQATQWFVAKADGTIVLGAGYSSLGGYFSDPAGGAAGSSDGLRIIASDFAAFCSTFATTGMMVIAQFVDGTTFSDRITVVKVIDGATGPTGAAAVVGYLTNESHTVPADASGVVTSYSGATGDFKIFAGAVDVSASFALSTAAGGNPQGLTVSYSGQTYTVTAGLDAGEDGGALTIRATGSGAYAGVVADKTFTLAKSKAGTAGADAKLIFVTSSHQTFRYSAAGVPSAQTTTFTLTRQNTTIAAQWQIRAIDGTVMDGWKTAAALAASGYFSSTSGDDLSMTQAQFNSYTALAPTTGLIVEARVVDGATLLDRISVVKVQDGATGATGAAGPAGAPAITALLTNEAHTVPADASGNVSAYTGATGDFKVYAGAADVSASFALSTKSGGNPQALTVGYAGQTYTVTGGLDASEEIGVLTILATGSGAYAGVTVEKTFSLTKSKTGSTGAAGSSGATGAAGSNAKLIFLASNYQTFKYDNAGAVQPQTLSLDITRQNTTAAASWQIKAIDGTVMNGWASAAALAASGYFGSSGSDNLTMTHTQWASYIALGGPTTGLIFEARVIDGDTLIDRISVVKVQDGATGAAGVSPIVIDLSVVAMDVAADAANITKTGALPKGSVLSLMQGTTALTPTSVGFAYSDGGGGAFAASYDAPTKTVSLTTANAPGWVDVNAVYGGTTYTKRIAISRSKDNAAPESVASSYANATGSSSATTYDGTGILAPEIILRANSSGALTATFDAEYYTDTPPTAVRSLIAAARFDIAPQSTGVFSSPATEQAGSQANWDKVDASPGVISMSRSLTGLTAGAFYRVRVEVRKSSGSAATVNITSSSFTVAQ